MFDFKNIIAWQRAHDFALEVYKVTRCFPDSEKYNIISQFQRAAVSIAANIAEGYKKLGKQDKLRFLNIAQGSLSECENYILLSFDLHYISKTEMDNLAQLAEETEKLLNAYCAGILSNSGIKENLEEI
ncbi:MAG: four helix bundle protein [Paludibacteraceae bacterium]|nr:four helix bundle protein [Paludibacteraceae bacterium]